MRLLAQRRFGPFFATQFLGAFNDNVFKNALVILIAFQAASEAGLSASLMVNLAAGLFILPFFLFSATAGQLADRSEKSRLMQRIKLAEVGIMLLALTAFWLQSLPLLIALLFLMGTQSAFFGPVKYGVLPQHLAEHELVGGNGLVSMGTFLAILTGTVLGGVLIAVDGSGPLLVGIVLVAVAVAGYLASRGIPLAPATSPQLQVRWNIAVETWRILRYTNANAAVFNSVLGISWFWFFGALLLAQLPTYTRDHLAGDEGVVTLLLTVFSLGIGIGSLLCERMSGRLVEIGLVPLGAFGMTAAGIDLALASPPATGAALVGATAFLAEPGNWRVLLDLLVLSVFGGFFIVPLYALVQSRSPGERRSRIIAGNNVLNALFMVVSSAVAIGLLAAGLSIPGLFLAAALMNAAVAIYIFTLVPEFLLRFIVWILIHTVYRLRIEGIDHIPDHGPAVLVCNHVSFVDALVIAAACRRPVHFVMDHRIYATPGLNWVFRLGGTIPIAPAREDEQLMQRAFDRVAGALEAGHLVGIFPEGRLTQDGTMADFRPGIERIVERTPVPVVPLALRGLYGSFFSRDGGRAMSHPLRLLTRLRSRIELVAAAPVAAADVSAAALRDQVADLRGDRA